MIPGLLVCLVLLAGGFWVWARWFEQRQAFHPKPGCFDTPARRGIEYEDVEFMTEDGCRLHGWWLPVPQAKGVILYFHGNAGNIGERVDLAADLSRLGRHVFLFDYRGYGRSQGRPSETGLYRDARAAYEVARARCDDADHPPIILYGASLGGAIAVHLATERPAQGLILEATFTNAVEVGRAWFPYLPVNLMSRYKFDLLGKLPRLHLPLLIAHSRDDITFPWGFGQRILAAANEPKTFVELQGPHGESAWTENPHYWTALKDFLAPLQ